MATSGYFFMATDTPGRLSRAPSCKLVCRLILPRTPATAVAGHGHTMFRMLLEDLSGTRIDDEDGRLTLLATLDHTPAVYQRAGARSLADGGRADLRQDHPTARLHRR